MRPMARSTDCNKFTKFTFPYPSLPGVAHKVIHTPRPSTDPPTLEQNPRSVAGRRCCMIVWEPGRVASGDSSGLDCAGVFPAG